MAEMVAVAEASVARRGGAGMGSGDKPGGGSGGGGGGGDGGDDGNGEGGAAERARADELQRRVGLLEREAAAAQAASDAARKAA